MIEEQILEYFKKLANNESASYVFDIKDELLSNYIRGTLLEKMDMIVTCECDSCISTDVSTDIHYGDLILKVKDNFETITNFIKSKDLRDILCDAYSQSHLSTLSVSTLSASINDACDYYEKLNGGLFKVSDKAKSQIGYLLVCSMVDYNILASDTELIPEKTIGEVIYMTQNSRLAESLKCIRIKPNSVVHIKIAINTDLQNKISFEKSEVDSQYEICVYAKDFKEFMQFDERALEYRYITGLVERIIETPFVENTEETGAICFDRKYPRVVPVADYNFNNIGENIIDNVSKSLESSNMKCNFKIDYRVYADGCDKPIISKQKEVDNLNNNRNNK